MALFFIAVVFFIIDFFISLPLMKKFDDRIKKVDYEQWQYLTSFGDLGPGNSNPARSIKYIFKGDVSDRELGMIMSKLRVHLPILGSLFIVIFMYIVLL